MGERQRQRTIEKKLRGKWEVIIHTIIFVRPSLGQAIQNHLSTKRGGGEREREKEREREREREREAATGFERSVKRVSNGFLRPVNQYGYVRANC